MRFIATNKAFCSYFLLISLYSWDNYTYNTHACIHTSRDIMMYDIILHDMQFFYVVEGKKGYFNLIQFIDNNILPTIVAITQKIE